MSEIFSIFTATYLLIAGYHHLWQLNYGRQRYLENIRRSINPSRWIEYSITCSIMTVLVSMLVGVTNTYYFMLIAVSIIVMNYCGYLIERYYKHFGTAHFKYLLIGSLFELFPFVLMIQTLTRGGEFYQFAIIMILSSLYVTFPYNVYRYISNPNERFITYEAVFTILSLITKLIITVTVMLSLIWL